MSWADIQFVQALVQTIPALASSTYLTIVPKQVAGQPPLTYPYALIHATGGTDAQSRYTGPYATEFPEFTIHFAGESAEQCQAVTDLFKAIVKPSAIGIVPTVSGRKNGRMFWRQPIPIQTNTDVTPVLCYSVVEVGWQSDPS
jgi:hypothetical protein